MGIYLSQESTEDLYASIHRITQQHVTCTLEQSKRAAKRFHDTRYTRIDAALNIYWELSENRMGGKASVYLESLREDVEEDAEKVEVKQFVVTSLKNFWLEEAK
jgi:hypothetical protein